MLYGKVHQKWFKIKVLKGSYKTLCWHCIVKPLSKIVAGVIKFKLTLWFYVSSLVRKFSFINLVMSFSSSRHQKKNKKQKNNNCTISDLAEPYKYKLVAWKRNIFLLIVYSEWTITSKLLKINPIQYYSHKRTNKRF